MKQLLRRLFRSQSPSAPKIRTVSVEDYSNSDSAWRDGLAIPPRRLWHSGAATFDEYMADGTEHYRAMRKDLSAAGWSANETSRVLDFGCGCGRTVRLWKDEPSAEVWGCELDPDCVIWCQQNLGPTYRFIQTSLLPHLPFEDRFFDLMYAGSVFTHISDYVDVWLLELRRILAPGGMFYLTIHDEHTWQLVRNGKGAALESVVLCDQTRAALDLPYDFISYGVDPVSQVFFRQDYFAEKVKCFFELVDIRPEARGYQTAFVLRKSKSAQKVTTTQ